MRNLAKTTVFLALLSACGGSDTDDVELEDGTYDVAATLITNGCLSDGIAESDFTTTWVIAREGDGYRLKNPNSALNVLGYPAGGGVSFTATSTISDADCVGTATAQFVLTGSVGGFAGPYTTNVVETCQSTGSIDCDIDWDLVGTKR